MLRYGFCISCSFTRAQATGLLPKAAHHDGFAKDELWPESDPCKYEFGIERVTRQIAGMFSIEQASECNLVVNDILGNP